MKLIDQLTESKEQFKSLDNLIETSEYLRDFKNSRIGFDGNIPKIILEVMYDYPEFVKIIKEVKKISKDLKFNHNFFSCGVMIFTWESDLIKLWFQCNPEEIPSELMPSSSCEVIKIERTIEESYQIVCDVSNPV